MIDKFLILLALMLGFGPFLAGFADVWCWVMIGHGVTGIEWTNPRQILVCGWTIFCILVATL